MPNNYTLNILIEFIVELMRIINSPEEKKRSGSPFPAHFQLVWNHMHNRWIDYCKPYSWGYAKDKYYNWRSPKSHTWKDEKYMLRAKLWEYNSTRTWDDVYDSEITWEE